METSGVVLDTDVLVSDLRGKTSVLGDIADRVPATTVVNAFELFHGAYESRESTANLSATRGLLASLNVLGLGVKAAERAGEVLAQAQKAGEALEIRDLLVGCISREEGLPLLTYNVKHFRRIPGLRVIDAGQPVDM
ncbi:MAG: type II toxin-antitoxin system VapC family toxin [Nitrososphaerota archaeon]|nr:type II toxin-antitoxin system VapC family toxin [Nitrososphaerota archaeon]